MSTLEKSLWNYVRRGMGKTWDATRHTDKLTPGIPDVSFGLNGINGWIELKVIPAWPKRKTTVVRLEHFTIPQRQFLIQRGRAGGHCFLLLRVGRSEHLLIAHDTISLEDWATKDELIRLAKGYWKREIDFKHLFVLLCSG